MGDRKYDLYRKSQDIGVEKMTDTEYGVENERSGSKNIVTVDGSKVSCTCEYMSMHGHKDVENVVCKHIAKVVTCKVLKEKNG